MSGLKILHSALVLLLLLPACGEEAPQNRAATPQEPDREAVGYYCNMIVVDHPGPKGQIFLADTATPLWFSSVRDTIAFTLLPEEPKDIASIFVNDMGQGSWGSPAPGSWIDARSAWYVIGSEQRGGMGAPEVVPFSDRQKAVAFAAEEGGEVLQFDAIPNDYIFQPMAEQTAPGASGSHSSPAHAQAPPSGEPVKHSPSMEEVAE